jgi:DNA-binding beta-propeller fold protein YncE
MTSKLALAYSINPNPVATTRNGENPSNFTITVVVSNPGRSGVALRKILIDIPAGADIARDLTADPDTVTISNGDPADWTVTRESALQISIVPASGNQGTLNNSLTFMLETLQVGHVDGVVPLTITEYYPAGTTPAMVMDDSTYTITKVPEAFRVEFYADQSSVPRGGNVELFWQGPSNADYELAYWDPKQQKTITYQGKPNDQYEVKDVQAETLFQLHVTHIGGNDKLEFTKSVDVHVEDSTVGIQSFAADRRFVVEGGTVQLSWQASAATNYCQLLVNDLMLADNLPTFSESYPVKPSGPSAYTIQAVDYQKHVRDSRSLPAIQIGSVKSLYMGGPAGVTTATGMLGTFAYISNTFGKNISIVDAKLDQVVKTITTNGSGQITTVNTPEGTLLCAAGFDHRILVIDANTNEMKGVIPTTKHLDGGIVGGMVAGKPMAYFTGNMEFQPLGVVPADLAAMKQGDGLEGLGSLDSTIGLMTALGTTPNGTQYLYVGPGRIWVIDPVSMKQVVIIDGHGGDDPLTGIAFAETGSATKVYALWRNDMQVIDASTNKFLRHMPFGGTALAYHEAENLLYVDSGGVQAIDVNTDQVVGRPIPTPTQGTFMAVTADGTKLYVVDRFSNQLYIVTYPQAWTQS